MQLSMHLYPWDLVHLGVRDVFDELEEWRVSSISLAANYHPIATFSPRPGRRRAVYTTTGGLLFSPTRGQYGAIRPEVWPDSEIIDAWTAAADEARRRGIKMNAWTIANFQPWVAAQIPSTSRVLPTGERIPATICPSAIEVQELLIALAVDLVEQFNVDQIELEGLGFPNATYGWVRPRLLTETSPLGAWLMSLCFCPNCLHRMATAGLQGEDIRRRVVALIDTEFASSCVDRSPWEQRLVATAGADDLTALAELRRTTIVDLVQAISRSLPQRDPAPRLSVWAPVENDGSEGVLLDRVIDHLAGIRVESARAWPARQARLSADTQRPRRVTVTSLLPNPWDSSPIDLDVVEAEVNAAIEHGIDRMAIYQFGTRSHSELGRLVDTVHAVLEAADGDRET